jgi:hypothetical protein
MELIKPNIKIYPIKNGHEILSFAHKWMELEHIILSDVIQVQKIKNSMFSIICGV